MKKNNVIFAGMSLFLVLLFAGCASTPKFQNVVSGSTWTFDEDGIAVVVSFVDAMTAELTIDIAPIDGSYIDVDSSGKNGKLTILEKWEDAKLQFAANMLQVGTYGTAEFSLFKQLSGNSGRNSVANTKWQDRTTGIPVELNFLPDGKATAEAHVKTSGTYKFISANTIAITSDYGRDLLTISGNELHFEGFILTRK
jgi:hypothetical protein